MNYQWYPGHMTKARRMMEENIKLIDLMIELVDARIPVSSRNPDIHTLGQNKSRLIVLNKCDLADEKITKEWLAFYESQNVTAVEVNAKQKKGVGQIQSAVQKACQEKIERDRKRGIIGRPVRAMVVGIPNVGKSTLINAIAGRNTAQTGNKPGVTKGKQWIRLNKSIELLDTPGILWPKMEDQITGLHLAMIGSMNDEIFQIEELALDTIKFLKKEYPTLLAARFPSCEGLGEAEALKCLEGIAKDRGCLKKGEELNLEKASNILLDEFRNGKLGRFTLERPND